MRPCYIFNSYMLLAEDYLAFNKSYRIFNCSYQSQAEISTVDLIFEQRDVTYFDSCRNEIQRSRHVS